MLHVSTLLLMVVSGFGELAPCLNVWSSSMEQESVWDNAYAGSKVRIQALRNNNSAASIWHVEKRNIFQDLKRHFGDGIRYINAIAIMTDTDNSKSEAIAYYGNIFFSAQ